MIDKVNNVYIEITSKCNSNCVHCYNDSKITNKEYLSYETIEGLVTQFIQANVQSVSLSGGEPLLHPEFERIAELLLKHFKVTIVTNGSLIKCHLEFIRQNADQLNIQISLDGYDSETYYKVRRLNCFDEVLDNIKLLKKLGVEIGINCVLTSYTYKNYTKFIELSKTLGVSLIFSAINQTGRGDGNADYYIDTSSILDEVKDEKERIQYFDKLSISYACPLLEHSDTANRIKISNTGNVFPCHYFTQPEYSMGSVYTENFSIIINRIDEIIEKAKEVFDNEMCNECFIRGFCKRGCIALSINNGRFISDNNCNLRKQGVISAIRGGKNTEKPLVI